MRVRAVLSAVALIVALVAVSAAPAAAVPGDLSKYLLLAAAEKDRSPTNPDDHVIRFTTEFGGETTAAVIRKVNRTVRSLDNELYVNYYLSPDMCFAGSPRISLFIDDDEDGVWEPPAERAIFGHVTGLGASSFVQFCDQDTWHHEDLTDVKPRWDLSQYGGGMNETWEAVELFFSFAGTTPGTPPSEQVVFAKLVDDSCAFTTLACGTAYYDTLALGDANQLWENWNDSVEGCSKEFQQSGIC